jgi:23S rRNA pseudouridine2605 synthase
MTTLLRIVIDATGLSRRKAFAAIREGRVTRDGSPLTDPSADSEPDGLLFDGQPLGVPAQGKVYLMLNKPPDYVSSAADELGRRTVLDLVPAEMAVPGLHSAGRLDRDTSGLLLLTNDGDLTYRLTHPRHAVEKEYWLRLTDPPTPALVAALRRGAEIDGEIRRPLRVEPAPPDTPFDLSIILREGRNRQVRRLVEAAGGRVALLRRVREGALELGSLPEGAVRALTPEEVRHLRG